MTCVMYTLFTGCYIFFYIIIVNINSTIFFNHSYYVGTNVTTNEAINFKRYKHFFDNNNKYRNPFDFGVKTNFSNLFKYF